MGDFGIKKSKNPRQLMKRMTDDGGGDVREVRWRGKKKKK